MYIAAVMDTLRARVVRRITEHGVALERSP